MKRIIDVNGTFIYGEHIMANVWGEQRPVILTDWFNLKRLGFKPGDRAFGTLNDGTKALYFGRENKQRDRYDWFLTTETMEEIAILEEYDKTYNLAN